MGIEGGIEDMVGDIINYPFGTSCLVLWNGSGYVEDFSVVFTWGDCKDINKGIHLGVHIEYKELEVWL